MTGKGKRLIILDKIVMERLSEKMTSEQHLKWKERASQVKVWAKSFPNYQTGSVEQWFQKPWGEKILQADRWSLCKVIEGQS